MKKKGFWFLFFAIALCLLTSPAMAEKQYLNMGSTSSTSGVYAWCVATANVINEAQNDIQVTVIESGAALDNLRKSSRECSILRYVSICLQPIKW